VQAGPSARAAVNAAAAANGPYQAKRR